MRYPTRKIIKIVFGVIFMIFGLVALITPFTPGSWLIFIGAELLGLRLLFREKFSFFWEKIKEYSTRK